MNEETRELIRQGHWEFHTLFDKAVFGCLKLANGWILCSMRCCMGDQPFEADIGKQLVKEDIIDQLVNLEAYKHDNHRMGWYKLPILDHEF